MKAFSVSNVCIYQAPGDSESHNGLCPLAGPKSLANAATEIFGRDRLVQELYARELRSTIFTKSSKVEVPAQVAKRPL